ncbi:MAG: GntR family transcriptional regulator, partial [Pseudomonadota bacterium]
DIQSQNLSPGTPLLTEMEICEKHSVSRHTAREALRILTEDGLIERRRGAGTVVAERQTPSFAQSIGDFDSLLQYARDASLTITEQHAASDETLDRLGLTGDYVCFIGLRSVGDQPPQAMTQIVISSNYPIDSEQLNQLDGPVTEWLAKQYGVEVSRVTQRIEACLLDDQQADVLKAKENTAALRTIRRYRDEGGRIILLSESLHPADRFAYEMRLDRR